VKYYKCVLGFYNTHILSSPQWTVHFLSIVKLVALGFVHEVSSHCSITYKPPKQVFSSSICLGNVFAANLSLQYYWLFTLTMQEGNFNYEGNLIELKAYSNRETTWSSGINSISDFGGYGFDFWLGCPTIMIGFRSMKQIITFKSRWLLYVSQKLKILPT
jgi:hypothetical protein